MLPGITVLKALPLDGTFPPHPVWHSLYFRVNQLVKDHKYRWCLHISSNIQRRARHRREQCTNQVQVSLIRHIKADRVFKGSCPLVKVSGEMFTTLDNQGNKSLRTLSDSYTHRYIHMCWSLHAFHCPAHSAHTRTCTFRLRETVTLVHTTAQTRPLETLTSSPNWRLGLMPEVSKHLKVTDCTSG